MPGLGRARLAIPKQKVAAAKPVYAPTRGGVATVKGTPATTPSQPSNAAVPATQSQPTNPFEATKATASTGLFAPPAYTPQAGQPDPRDSTYWANLSKLMFTSQQEYSKSLADQQFADTSYNDALQTAIRNRGLQQRDLGENAIRGNLGSSGWLNRNEAQQTSEYTQQRANASLTKQQEDQARVAARNAILQGFGIDAAAELAAAAARYAEGAGATAQNGAPEYGLGGLSGLGGATSPFPNAPIGSLIQAANAAKIGVGNAQAVNPVKAAISNRKKVKK